MPKFLASFILFIVAALAHAAEPARLVLESNASTKDLHPREDTLTFRIHIQDSMGRAIPSARLRLQLKAPDSPWIASTDFPIVEGSQLLDQTLEWQGSEHAFSIVPPIRGIYTLTASVTPLPGDTSFAASTETLQVSISESPARKQNLAVLLALLIGVGGISGYILGRGARPATLLALLLLFVWPPPSGMAHGPDGHKSKVTLVSDAQPNAQGSHIVLDVFTKEPRVGELASLIARYANAEGKAEGAVFQLNIMQMEHQHLVFSTEVTAPDGILRWSGQFFDGSPHRILLSARALGKGAKESPATFERDVEVTGIEPPLRSIAKSLGFLMLVATLALVSGIALSRIRPSRQGRLA